MIRLFSNNIDRTLAEPLTDVATTLTLDDATGLREPTTVPNVGAASNPPTGSTAVNIPQAEFLTLMTVVDGVITATEIVRMTGRAGNVCTVVRAQEGTTAQAWAAGTRVIAASTAGTYGAFLQNSSTHAQGIAVDDHRISRGAFQGYASAQGQWAISMGVNSDADGIHALAIGGDFTGAKGYSTALGSQARAYGARAVSVGWAAQNNEADRTTLVGALTFTNTTNSTLIGYDALANRNDAVAVGSEAVVQQVGGVAIGRSAFVYGNTDIGFGGGAGTHGVAVGFQSNIGFTSGNNGIGCVAVGGFSFVSENSSGAIALGYQSEVEELCPHSMAIGTTYVETERTCQIAALPAVPRNWNAYTTSDAAWAMCAPTTVIMSDVVDLKTVADVTAPIWDGVRFFPEEVGLIITAAAGVTGQPTIRFGTTGTLDKLLAATATTGLDAAHKRERFQTLASSDGESSLTAGVTVGATATTLTGRFYWKGFAVVNSV